MILSPVAAMQLSCMSIFQWSFYPGTSSVPRLLWPSLGWTWSKVFHRLCIETALRALGRAGQGHCPLCRQVIDKSELLEKPAATSFAIHMQKNQGWYDVC